MDKPRILLVEDDENFGMILKDYIELHDFEVDWEKLSSQAINRLSENWYSLCILDVMLPDMDGFDLARRIRRIHPEQRFIFLSAKNLKKDILEGFQIGAEDYLVKPFDSEILIQKIQKLIERTRPDIPRQTIIIGHYIFNPESRSLEGPTNTKKLSPKESALLELLYQHLNRLLRRDYALTRIWGNDSYFSSRSMDVFINKLRNYLSEDASIVIETIHGEGYLLRVE